MTRSKKLLDRKFEIARGDLTIRGTVVTWPTIDERIKALAWLTKRAVRPRKA